MVNLILVILAFLPALIYSFIVYLNDRKNIRTKSYIMYILSGCVSVLFVYLAHFLFPGFFEPTFLQHQSFSLVYFSEIFSTSPLTTFFYAFIQVALIEELSKFLSWVIMTFARVKNEYRSDSLFSTMFYICMVSVGFAGIENIQYFMEYNGASDVILARSTQSVLAHMISGLMMGYFFAISRFSKGWLKSVWTKFLGVFTAILFHGFYDYLLMLPNINHGIYQLGNYTVFLPTAALLILGLIVSMVFGQNLLNYSSRTQIARKKGHQPVKPM